MICTVEKDCIGRACKDENSPYNNMNNCTCRTCLEGSKDPICKGSGDAYNTEGDCIIEK